MFPLVINTCTTEILPFIAKYLSTLEEKIDFYFPSLNTAQCDWIRNPFLESTTKYSLTLTEEELMIKQKSCILKLFGFLSKKNMSRYLKKR